MYQEDPVFSGSTPSTESLVANFAFLQFDKIISELRELRSSGSNDETIDAFLSVRAKNIDPLTKSKILILSQNKIPEDDFTTDEIELFEQPNERTINLRVSNISPLIKHGSLVFLKKKRWIVASLVGKNLRLKSF